PPGWTGQGWKASFAVRAADGVFGMNKPSLRELKVAVSRGQAVEVKRGHPALPPNPKGEDWTFAEMW
uniref:hypothetical protein n=1 Tax=Klebsiella aerogenes TaxID=548 RepID=UPI001952B42E